MKLATKNIAIISHRHLGDVLLGEPAIRWIVDYSNNRKLSSDHIPKVFVLVKGDGSRAITKYMPFSEYKNTEVIVTKSPGEIRKFLKKNNISMLSKFKNNVKTPATPSTHPHIFNPSGVYRWTSR